jgi:SOS-response transcriptional repressor LexA
MEGAAAAGVVGTRAGELRLLEVCLPGKPAETCGVLLHDPGSGELAMRLRRDWDALTSDGNDLEVLESLARDLEAKAAEMGAEALLAYLDSTLSNVIRVTEPERVLVGNLRGALNRLYERHVAASVREYVTHLPLYSVRAAAGSYGERQRAEEEGWIEVPEGLPVRKGLFVARVVGRSMEPEIPSGSLCIFREPGAGSRNGKLVLVEDQSEPEHGERYTVKRYRSVKKAAGDGGGWEHAEIWMEPLNPEFEPWQLTEDKPARVAGEFVAVLE